MTTGELAPDDTVVILTPEGRIEPSPAAEPYLERLATADDELWRQAFRQMTLVRAFDREATNLQRQGELALYVPLEGQEAAQIGSGLATRPQDAIFPSYREHAVGFTRGLDLVNVLALLRGVTNAGWDPADAQNFRNYVLVIGSQTLHATGYAMGQKFDGATGTGNLEQDEASIVYFGDGATSQGDVSEALVFARSFESPLVFFLQNNHWAISVPVEVQSPTPLHRRGAGFGMPGIRIDGNDVMASWAVTGHHLDAARSGEGPAFIEALTYRMGAHTTSDDPTKYRTREEEQYWRDRDPIARLDAYLRAQGEDASFFDSLAEEARDFAADVRKRTLELPNPDPLQVFAHPYAEPHAVVEAQREAYLDFEASFDEEATA
ncbi:thiamine pyrophosphate-dependent dehydrogenase E1 component subunit alpha [Gulosibacter macacae]|uniref:2-oxoisovalerate dehydrogenase subunit alpha n=1 Tax=Gulosibacter macacae TaxID=2488791 RepID=A0A3P3W0Z8_9MICO|nr:thiamine pyrophosphate-dependent dehydrogenase E1 component subunit alpha [Gulosibacter macacae]RRJ86553.1 thiamine pyrophosphate-dependent dehydrogenase E1 component subunit alpha [Gulosibacter macacae]